MLAAAGACTGVVGFTGSAGIRDDMAIADLGSTYTRMNAPTASRLRPSAGYLALSAAGALVLVVMLVRLGVFLQAPDPLAASGWSATPWNPFLTRHACSTAYWVAATRIDGTPNVYDPATYTTGALDPVTHRPIPLFVGPFPVDPYEYPPTFLVLPRLLTRGIGAYATFRWIWTGLCTIVAALGLVLIARRIDQANQGHSLWLVPLVLVPPGILVTIQAGNVQLAMFAIALMGMLAFERRRPAIGGLLLAFAVVSKMFPGLLLLYLVVRREWRAVAWTAAWGVAFVLLAIADVGWAPFAAFRDHLPKLLSGDAFPMLRFTGPPDVNLSAPGLILKLTSLGGPAVPLGAIRVAGWIYSAVIVLATAWLAMRPLPARVAPLAWLIVLGLASLRSPFLPFYGAYAAVWIATLLLGVFWRDVRTRAVALGAWVILLPVWAGPPGLPPAVIAGTTTLQILVMLGLFAYASGIARRSAPLPASPAEGRP